MDGLLLLGTPMNKRAVGELQNEATRGTAVMGVICPSTVRECRDAKGTDFRVLLAKQTSGQSAPQVMQDGFGRRHVGNARELRVALQQIQ